MSAYATAAHRVQTAIAFLIGSGKWKAAEPKHLRAGIDLSKSDMGGLAELLIAKGVFTNEEYIAAVTRAAEREADDLEKTLQDVLGHPNVKTI